MTLRKLILASVLLFLYVSLTAQENSNIAASPQVFDFGNITTDHDGKAVVLAKPILMVTALPTQQTSLF